MRPTGRWSRCPRPRRSRSERRPPRTSPRASLTTIEGQVMCVACHESLAVAQSPQANAERTFIRGLIAQGETDQQIEQQLVAQYGPAVLGRPPAHGFNLTVYILPPAILVAGAAALALALPRWRRRARAAPPRRSVRRWTPPTCSDSKRTSRATRSAAKARSAGMGWAAGANSLCPGRRRSRTTSSLARLPPAAQAPRRSPSASRPTARGGRTRCSPAVRRPPGSRGRTR